MVTWAADGNLVGYNPTSKKLVLGTYKFASAGTVDVNASTRLGYPLAAQYPSATYPNRLQADARLTFTAGDIAANPGKNMCAAMFIAPSTAFAAGVTPTPDQIRLAPGARVYRASTSRTTAGTQTFSFPPGYCPAPGTLLSNVKHWVAIIPTAVTNTSSAWNVINDAPVAGNLVNTMGRALSFWPDRSPTAPVIVTPTGNSVISPGDVVQFTYESNDPDEVLPDDTTRYNRDLAGVQVQYAPVATVENPTPTWQNLTYYSPTGQFVETVHFRGDGGGIYHGTESQAILTQRGFPILCGSDEVRNNHAALPGGDWQLRVRTFDFGHPYPSTVNPLGVAIGSGNQLNPDNYPAGHVSPWSLPVKIAVPAQVPPPTPLYPTDSIAVQEHDTVRLSWLYRNTFQPAYPQLRRTVQIRAVGDTNWSNIFDGYGALPYVDLPATLVQAPPVLPTEYMTDPSFEGGTVDGWTESPPDFQPDIPAGPPSNVSGAYPASRTGTHHLESSYVALTGDLTGLYGTAVYREFDINPLHDVFTSSVWVSPQDSDVYGCIANVGWLDADGNLMESTDPMTAPSATVLRPESGVWPNAWEQLDLYPQDEDFNPIVGPFTAPLGAAKAVVQATVLCLADPSPVNFRMDDVSFYGSSSAGALDDFSTEATTQYEWRVRVQDADAVWSDFSEPARYWVVDAGESGQEKPVPSGTIEGATLGCGTHRVEVYRRGGLERTGELTQITHVDWGRLRDDISTAKVIVKGWDIDCGNLLSKLQTWAYEIVIFRDNGTSVDRVWEGPITLLTYDEDEVVIEAKDVMAYPYRRIIKQRMNDSGTGNGTTVTDRAARIIRNVMAPDDPNLLAYLTVMERPDDPMQYRSTPAYSRTAFEEVDDMAANAGLDYTAVGRRIILWSTKHRIGTLPEFKDTDFGSPPKVSEYGMSLSNRYVVSDGNGVWGEATRLDVSGNDETYGLVEMLSSTWASDSTEDSGTYTQEGLQTVIESFEGYAERSIADRYGPPVVVRVPDNTTLNPGTVLSIQQLVPGVVVPLRSFGTLRKVVATQKLDSIKVTETGGSEKITITLSPFSRDDLDSGEGGEE